MAGWIKMRHVLATHPKVVTLALRIGNADVTLERNKAHALGALFLAWCVADQLAPDDGTIAMSAATLDALTGTPGLTAAMVEVGWMRDHGDSLQFVDYLEHNGTTDKKRAQTARRVARSRSRNAPVTHVKRSGNARALPEEKREDLGSSLLPDPSLEGSVFSDPDGTAARAHSTFEFEAWYSAYPKRTGHRAAAAAWHDAIGNLVASGVGRDAAVAKLQAAVEEFARSPKGQGQFVPNPATWLSEGRYDDDRASWRDSGAKGRPKSRGESYVDSGGIAEF